MRDIRAPNTVYVTRDRVTNGQTASDSRSDRIKAQMEKSMPRRLKLPSRVLETRQLPIERTRGGT